MMENILLPTKIKVQENKENKNEAKISIEPCYPGYGITLGSALRRVLLSSLPGAAVTAIKIKGVPHEFSVIPNVKEDVVEILLNLKLLKLKILSQGLYKLNLNINGEKKAKAKDIVVPSQVKITNPELDILTTTSKSAKVEMEIWVEQGRGYVSIEDKEREKFELGVIVTNSIFTPIRKVGMDVEDVRVGEKTNYDKLTLNIETDGSLTPKEALEESAQILINHLNFIVNEKEEVKEIEEVEEDFQKKSLVKNVKDVKTKKKSVKKVSKTKK
ncbi:MAG: DNA-directed RNA polymerase subunit alpha [Patescibacteria group bacterium]